MSVSKGKIKTGQPLLEGRDWLGSPAKREVLEAHSHPFLQTIMSAREKRKRRTVGGKKTIKWAKRKKKRKAWSRKQ